MVVDHQQMPDALLQPEIFIAARRALLTHIEKHELARAARDPTSRRMALRAESGHKQ